MSHVLVVEDEPAIAMAVEDALLAADCRVSVVDRCRLADSVLAVGDVDCVVLDRMLPEGDGLTWLQKRRSQSSQPFRVPVLMLSARSAEDERCDGLEGGADDFLAKPFSPRELLARIDNLLKRSGPARLGQQQLAGVCVDFDAHTADGHVLTEHEFGLLSYLFHHPGRVVSRQELLVEVWGFQHGTAEPTRAVDMCVTGVRRKLGAAADRLVTVRGGGYRLDAE